MSRTPKAEISSLPIWAQKLIASQINKIDQLELNLEEALGWVDNLEGTLEGLTKELEERRVSKHENSPDNVLCSDRDCCPLPCKL